MSREPRKIAPKSLAASQKRRVVRRGEPVVWIIDGEQWDALIQEYSWDEVLRRPISLGAIADLVQKFVPEKETPRTDSVDEHTLGEAMTLAWQNTAAKKPSSKRR